MKKNQAFISYGIALILPLFLLFTGWPWLTVILVSIGCLGATLLWQYVNQHAAKEQILKEKQNQLLIAYRFIKVLIMQKQSPYQAMQTVLTFIPDSLGESMHQLLLAIDQDKSLQPYLHFANGFHSLMVEQLMFALYQLENQGGDATQLQQFQYLFDQAERQHYQHELAQFHEKMQQQNNLVMVATVFIAMALLLGVMTLIGGMIRGV